MHRSLRLSRSQWKSASTQPANSMKAFRLLLTSVILFSFLLSACGGNAPTEPAGIADYAAAVSLDMNSSTVKQEVTVKSYIDGDTTHFYVPETLVETGVLKARYLAVNTPESTGKIEEYGKAASAFTKEKLSQATSIIIESDDSQWNWDSTGERYLVWVWYRTGEDEPYRNLNIELLQNGLALANSAGQNRYGETCLSAVAQARSQKLSLYSGQKDPDFYYGDAYELTLKELRSNIESYNNKKVAFNGVVYTNSGSQGVYVEEYDPETDLYYGMYIYYGHGLNGTGLDIISVGNRVRIVGTVQYYEAGGSWQVSGLSYRMMQPDDPGNIQKLSEGHSAAYVLTDPATFVNGQVTILSDEGQRTIPYTEAVLGTSMQMHGLQVVDVYTTDNGGSSDGAMTLTCNAGGVTVTVRTAILLDENGDRITEDVYLGKTIDVKGVVEYYDGEYQIKVLTAKHIIIK